jgi:hypothetical protein
LAAVSRFGHTCLHLAQDGEGGKKRDRRSAGQ